MYYNYITSPNHDQHVLQQGKKRKKPFKDKNLYKLYILKLTPEYGFNQHLMG